jgi:hypothetical protein
VVWNGGGTEWSMIEALQSRLAPLGIPAAVGGRLARGEPERIAELGLTPLLPDLRRAAAQVLAMATAHLPETQ